jgi:glycosyltransferase involved in cell wall biosynthesis
MEIVYAIRHVGLTGGVKVFFQHIELLRKMGHKVHLITRFIDEKIDEDWGFRVVPEKVPAFKEMYVPEADGIVVTTPKDVEDLWKIAKKRGIPLFHFIQSFETQQIIVKINGDVVPDRFLKKNLLTKIKYMKKVWGWKRRLKRFDKLYRLPTVKIVISPHLVTGIEKRYNTPCYLLPNGIDQKVYYPKEKELDYSGTIRIASVGNFSTEWKGIPDILKAVKILKEEGKDIFLTRVAPPNISEAEKNYGVVDRFLIRISEQEMANLYRETHIFITASTEIEGFGLPPVEAMSTGTPVILTKISPFLAFDKIHDYAYFVDVHKPEEIAEGVVAIAKDRALRERLIERGLKVSGKYSLEMLGGRLEEILRRHIGKRRI